MILSLDRVGISYGKTQIVHDVSLQVRKGEAFGLIGLNGQGKTSLIKAILGLREPDGGSIEIAGKNPSDPASRAGLVFLPERFDPPWFLSGMEFIAFTLRLYGRRHDREQALIHARRVALDEDALKRKVRTYSKGMRQKLGLIATVMTGCPLLILDEPMSGLDPEARARVKDLLVECRSQGRTVFFTSHILADMDELCDRVAVLHGGTIRFTGSPADLRQATGQDTLERAFLHSIEKKDAA